MALSRAHAAYTSSSPAAASSLVGVGNYLLYLLPVTLHFGWTTAAALVNWNGSVAMVPAASAKTVAAVGVASAVLATAVSVAVTLSPPGARLRRRDRLGAGRLRRGDAAAPAGARRSDRGCRSQVVVVSAPHAKGRQCRGSRWPAQGLLRCHGAALGVFRGCRHLGSRRLLGGRAAAKCGALIEIVAENKISRFKIRYVDLFK